MTGNGNEHSETEGGANGVGGISEYGSLLLRSFLSCDWPLGHVLASLHHILAFVML